jgi:hypothetical protein
VEGLTLRAEDARADDTQTLIEVSLEGRPELGRIFGFEPKLGPGPEISRVRAVDDAGAIYNVGVVEHDGNRGMVLHFAPVSPNTLWLDLIVPAVSFVAPEDEPGPGEAPPVASSSVGGPWRVRIDEIPRTDVVRIPLHLEPQALGAGAAVPFEVIQTAQGTVLGIRFDGVGDPGDAGFVPFPELRWSDGERVPGRNGAPQTGSGVVYMAYEPTHGEVTLTLRPFIIVGLPDNVCTALDEQNCAPREEIERRGPEVEARRTALEALFADQPLPSWKFTIP